ncbi:hypothetical protein SEVIR_6G077600v4 [Setaria viridis]|uniref:Uncharacterized protein n=4 Tax=Setaria TaxID=4554 RepID=A0A368RJ49_SETIT|nr:uncharacterized protein LOC101777358 [Setaria italica]XP_034600229.1 uncharacterized protein LOC117860910 [Setaria viridis]RCV30229.1 hypothetical protein SETIT_6G077400v2 [Setaria italica]TKW09195.1 hypothetical protein SEVIR_6G077600v2 [Setaria viridis]
MASAGDGLAGAPSSSPPPLPPPRPPPPPPAGNPNHNHQSHNHAAISSPLLQSAADADAPLSRWLRRLEAFLTAAGLAASTRLGVAAAASALAVLGLALPAAAVALSPCRGGRRLACDEFEVEAFEVCVLLSQAAAAAVALGCVSRKMAMYGLRKFLFVDPELGMRIRFQKEYVAKIQDFFSILTWWILPCFVVKVARELFRFSHIFQESVWRACVVFSASIMSWMYLTTIILSSCMLFHLVCNLQVIHFDDYGKLLEQDADPLVYLKEHLQLRHNLSKISHRFRMFLLLLFISVTASQFAILFKTTAYIGPINFTNGGDIAVSSVVQVVGLVLCLHAAAKISHRAQNISSIASRWHALATCSTDSNYVTTPNSSGNLMPFPAHLFLRDYSESDLESLESAASLHGNSQGTAQLASYMSSYHKRESLVLYLLANPGGITIFGWIVDRAFLNTILMLELTLVLFVLSKTVVIPSKTLMQSYIGLT